MHLLVLLVLLLGVISAEKITSEILNNYSEFLNFGDKKINKLNRANLENAIFKSKVDVLGEIFKNNIDALKAWGKLDLVFLIDASSSIGEENFKSELKFVKKLMSDVTVDYNHTRVAIVTFSSSDSVIKNVDEISDVSTENNKCLLLNRQMNEIKYTGGGTYTLGAFKMAKEIFANSRNDSKKVLLLITDGFSNGGDPVPLANELKENQTTIFTIGIKSGNYRELHNLSTAPGELYSYLLDSFEEFESLARRALHVDLQSGEYIPLSKNDPCDALCEKGDCCDKNAVCTCGTSTGHYSCLCQLGYYGSGYKNSCLPCPSGTYANGPNLCIPCPDLHHITIAPATSIKSCKCDTGYQPTKDKKCEVLKCPKQLPPEHGYFVKRRECGNVLHTACGVRCEVGYTLEGSSIRLCQANGTWSGDTPSCQVKTCEPLSPPMYGTILCKHSDLGTIYNDTNTSLPVDTVCSFTCEKGRTLVGSNQRTCLPLARWDGLRTSCKQIKCSKLPEIKYGIIEPKSCLFGKQPFGKNCSYACKEGFKLRGPKQKSCTEQYGIWNPKDEQTFCDDITPPVLTCPENLTAFSSPGKNFGVTFWMEPKSTDNSGLDVTLWSKPSIKNITDFKFKIGATKVTYFAQDPFGNRAKCSFYVTVIDKESPVIEDCESPPVFLSVEKNGTDVVWDEPNVYDNSDEVIILKSHDFGFFPMGTTTVTYTVSDKSNNTNSCTMNITIEEAHCEALPDPIYGHSDCAKGSDGINCVITCQEGYAVPIETPAGYYESNLMNDSTSFICKHSDPIWYNQQGLMFPECSVTELPTEVIQKGTVEIEQNRSEDVCDDTTRMNEIENDIQTSIYQKLKGTCTNDTCSLNAQAFCGDKDESAYEENTNRIKRDVSKPNTRLKERRINVKFQLRAKLHNQKQMNNSDFDITTKLKHVDFRNKNTSYKISLDEVKMGCRWGYILKKDRCVQCPKGTFHNSTMNTCDSCPLGYYNDELGSTTCKSCPNNFSTKRMHVKSLNGCKAKCPPGTHARKKIVKRKRSNETVTFERITLMPNCRSCPKGTYQPHFGQLKCLRCPEGFTTAKIGSTSADFCIPQYQNVCLKSLNVCNNGLCVIDSDFYYSCNCNNDYIGSHCETLMNGCSSNPCLNGAVCEPVAEMPRDYACTCKEGFTGKNCENAVDTCPKNCTNGSICAQTDDDEYLCLCQNGYGGENCEIKLRYCQEGLCQNGAICKELQGGFFCECKDGYIGRRCNILPCDYKPCNENAVCVNLPLKNATKNDYRCECPQGYKGTKCDQIVDHCESNPCTPKATCTSNSTTYTCHCPKNYGGRNCTNKLNTTYILNFYRTDTNNYIKLKGPETNLSEISVCLWMQTFDSFNYGTILSYANHQYDNAFTLTDYTGLVMYVNNKHVITDVHLNDGFWHYVCATWQSNDGHHAIYVDGFLKYNGSGLALNDSIKGSGNLVIGQEQDILGGKFSQAESFIGKMAYIDIWSRILPQQEIVDNMNLCNDDTYGDLYGWPQMQYNIRGDILVENSSFCQQCDQPRPMYNGFIDVIENVAYYKCNKGFQISNIVYSSGRKCTKAKKWEGKYEPFCKRVYCGYPGYVRNGFIIGNKYYYQDKIYYKCYDGYDLIGSVSQVCKENGLWYPDKPTCKGVQCGPFKKPQNAQINILADHSIEEFNAEGMNFDVGTQIEFSCPENANLTGENLITCLENGTWDFESPQCVVEKENVDNNLPCPLKQLPQAPPNGYIVLETLLAYGNGTTDVIEYKCRIGYKLNGDNFTTCILDGYWTEVNTSCDPITCRSPPQPKNMLIKHANLTNGSYYFGNMVTYECADGYRMFGNNVIRCMANGKWSRVAAKCTRKSCYKPAVSEETIVKGNSYLYEDEVILACPNGLKYTLTCDKDGKWVGDRDESC